jgi:hypothetical protein
MLLLQYILELNMLCASVTQRNIQGPVWAKKKSLAHTRGSLSSLVMRVQGPVVVFVIVFFFIQGPVCFFVCAP